MIVFSLLYLATSQYYGFVGGGTLFLLQSNEHGTLDEIKSFDWSDGLFDLVSYIYKNPKTKCGMIDSTGFD